ncbi:MAG TPA: Clp protease N-terminal domain-containing protein [Drouetiella sp.]|jgi:ATP-dependent Clp protease ATP-binding subunit ClpC
MFERIKTLIELNESIFDCFTSEALEVVNIAENEARSMHHRFIGTEHILLGLIAESEGTAAQALMAQGVELGKARLEVTKIRGESRGKIPPVLPFTPSAKRLLEDALKHSRSCGLSYVGTEHLLLGLIEPGKGASARVLRDLGISRDDLRKSLRPQ